MAMEHGPVFQMYSLLKMGTNVHCHVSLLDGKLPKQKKTSTRQETANNGTAPPFQWSFLVPLIGGR